MSTSVTDESANRDNKINNAAKVIGKSRDRLKVFEAIYFKKNRIKTQKFICDRTGLIPKRVLEEGKKLTTERIINQTKDVDNKTAYEKIDFYYKNKKKIFSLVKKNLNNENIPKTIRIIRKIPQKKKKNSKTKWDVFICHATENKKAVAKPLANRLKKEGLNVWYDEFELDWGSRLMSSINTGLKKSLFGIVILSKQFFKKEWAQRELEGLHSLSMANNENKILPLLYKMSHKELTNSAPLLSDIIYKKWEEGLDKISKSIITLVKKKKMQE